MEHISTLALEPSANRKGDRQGERNSGEKKRETRDKITEDGRKGERKKVTVKQVGKTDRQTGRERKREGPVFSWMTFRWWN